MAKRPPEVLAAQAPGPAESIVLTGRSGGWSGRCARPRRRGDETPVAAPRGWAVLGRPGLELGVMGQEQVGQILGVLGVVLGAAGDEGLAELLEGDGVDRDRA